MSVTTNEVIKVLNGEESSFPVTGENIYDKIVTKHKAPVTFVELLQLIEDSIQKAREEYTDLIPRKSITDKETILFREANLLGRIEVLEELLPAVQSLVKKKTKARYRGSK